jgi:hypothetical protein
VSVRSALRSRFGESFRCDRPWEGSNVDQAVGADIDHLGDGDGIAGSGNESTSDDDG